MTTHRLFLLDHTARRDPAVDEWLDSHPGELGTIARHWFTVMRGCGDDVREVLHDGHPTACIGNAAFAYVDVFSEHANVGFYHGAALPDPSRILRGSGRFMRHVKVGPGHRADPDALGELIAVAYEDLRARTE